MAIIDQDGVSVEIIGVEKVLKQLHSLDKKVQAKIERRGVREAGRPVLAAARRLAPIAEEYDVHDPDHTPGTLQKSLRLRALKRTRSRRRAGIYGVQIQTGAEMHMFKGETFYGGMVEFGTKFQTAQFFLRAARDETEGQANMIFRSELARYVEEECKSRG